MASSTNTESVPIPEQHVPEPDVPKLTVSEQDVPELVVHEQPVPELVIPEQVIYSQSPTTNTIAKPETSINDQPSSSNLAIQPCALAKKNVPSPPTLFLDSIFLANVCENIF